jgi:hypothetical protein
MLYDTPYRAHTIGHLKKYKQKGLGLSLFNLLRRNEKKERFCLVCGRYAKFLL